MSVFQKSFFYDSMWDGWYRHNRVHFISLYPHLVYLRNGLKELCQMEKKSDSRHGPCMNVLLHSDGFKRKICFHIAFRFRWEAWEWCRMMIRIAQKVPFSSGFGGAQVPLTREKLGAWKETASRRGKRLR